MGFFDNFNPFDPAGLMGGGGPLGGGGGEASSGGVTVLGGGGGNKDEEFDVKKAYGFTSPSTDSQFNTMRRKQMGMGGQGG